MDFEQEFMNRTLNKTICENSEHFPVLETSENAQKPEFLRGFQVHSYIAHLCPFMPKANMDINKDKAQIL